MKPESRMKYAWYELLAELSAHGANIVMDHGIDAEVDRLIRFGIAARGLA